MTHDLMEYNKLVESALRGVIRSALQQVRDKGLPGNHHFYLTFATDYPGVHIPESLMQRYPKEMTIVLQYQFYGLEVFQDHFEITLSFNNISERLHIPFAAISIFADPHVNFALQFESFLESGDDDDDDEIGFDMDDDDDDDSGGNKKKGEVVSLDQFRNK